MRFKPEQFVPTKWDTQEDKARFANTYREFVLRGFPRKYFAAWFYKRLSMTFGHIAHYDIHGFWDEFFTSTAGKVEFLTTTINHPCFGDPGYTYSDVEKEIQKWLKEDDILNRYRHELIAATEDAERSELRRLKAKYE